MALSEQRKSTLLTLTPNNFLFINTKVSLTATLRLQNITSQKVAFKIKTNVPESYIVRPNQGVLTPEQAMEVLITLKAKEVEGGKPHKFSILASPTDIDPNDTQALQDLWKNPAALKEKQQTVIGVKFSEGEERKVEESEADQIMVSMRMSRVSQEPAGNEATEQSKPGLSKESTTVQSVSEPVHLPEEVSERPIQRKEAEMPGPHTSLPSLPKHEMSPFAVFCLIASVVTVIILLLKLLGR